MVRVTNLDEPHQIGTTFQAWNFACIPVTCKNPDRVMKFYDWVFSSQANDDLFELGVEGVHWNAVGDNGYEASTNPATGNNYNFSGYLMTWNPTLTRQSASIPEIILSDIEKCTDQTYFYKEIASGFSFDSSAVKTEAALISDVVSMKTAWATAWLPITMPPSESWIRSCWLPAGKPTPPSMSASSTNT